MVQYDTRIAHVDQIVSEIKPFNIQHSVLLNEFRTWFFKNLFQFQSIRRVRVKLHSEQQNITKNCKFRANEKLWKASLGNYWIYKDSYSVIMAFIFYFALSIFRPKYWSCNRVVQEEGTTFHTTRAAMILRYILYQHL